MEGQGRGWGCTDFVRWQGNRAKGSRRKEAKQGGAARAEGLQWNNSEKERIKGK